MTRTTTAKARAIETTVMLLRRKGYHATGLSEIIAESGTPKGSFYFHFPEGKEQLAAEALIGYAARVSASIGKLREATAGDANAFVKALCAAAAAEMQASDWSLGCAVQNVLNEGAGLSQSLLDVANSAVETWISELQRAFDGAGAREKAIALLAGLEGARTLAKATRTTEPFEAVAKALGGHYGCMSNASQYAEHRTEQTNG